MSGARRVRIFKMWRAHVGRQKRLAEISHAYSKARVCKVWTEFRHACLRQKLSRASLHLHTETKRIAVKQKVLLALGKNVQDSCARKHLKRSEELDLKLGVFNALFKNIKT